MGFAMFVFIFWPFVEAVINRVFKRDLSILIGVLVIIGIMALTLWEALAH